MISLLPPISILLERTAEVFFIKNYKGPVPFYFVDHADELACSMIFHNNRSSTAEDVQSVSFDVPKRLHCYSG